MLIQPDWPAPSSVFAAMTTRSGGVSVAPFDSLNLGYATEDDRNHVLENERITARAMGVEESQIRWVYQVHGNVVREAESLPPNSPLGATTIEGDAIVSRTAGLLCGVKVADCMPVLLAASDGSAVAAAHAGWRGLSAGVVENTLALMRVSPDKVIAWLGPCIGPTMFEVGVDVRAAFLDTADAKSKSAIDAAFVPTSTEGKFLCDLFAIARERLSVSGVNQVFVSGACTMSDREHFFSHRRDKKTGRMAAFIGIRQS